MDIETSTSKLLFEIQNFPIQCFLLKKNEYLQFSQIKNIDYSLDRITSML
jgi:hypothetical protein